MNPVTHMHHMQSLWGSFLQRLALPYRPHKCWLHNGYLSLHRRTLCKGAKYSLSSTMLFSEQHLWSSGEAKICKYMCAKWSDLFYCASDNKYTLQWQLAGKILRFVMRGREGGMQMISLQKTAVQWIWWQIHLQISENYSARRLSPIAY